MKKILILIILSLIFVSCGRIDTSKDYSCTANLNSDSWQQTSNPGGAFIPHPSVQLSHNSEYRF
jgi:hypothetical protein